MSLSGKLVLVTGSGRGIGKAILMRFSQENAKVISADIDESAAQHVAEDIEKIGGYADYVKLDVRKFSEVHSSIEKIVRKHGEINVLVNNAGIYPSNPVKDITESEWDQVLSVNLKGIFNCSRAILDSMIKNKSGSIINIASVDGKIPPGGNAHYAAAKAGAINLTKTFALELAQYNIRVNAVAPGWIATETLKKGNRWEKILGKIPLKRLGEPEEVADAVIFLASDSASYITGEILDVNGGLLMD